MIRYFKGVKCHKGYTLLELLIVMALIGILSTYLTPRLENPQKTSRIKAARVQFQSIAAALEMYRAHKGTLPTSVAVLKNEKFYSGDDQDPFGDRISICPGPPYLITSGNAEIGDYQEGQGFAW